MYPNPIPVPYGDGCTATEHPGGWSGRGEVFCVPGCSVVSNPLQPHGLQPARLLCQWDFPGKNTGVSCHAPLQGIFPTQGSNPGLPHGRRILYPLNQLGFCGSSVGKEFACNAGAMGSISGLGRSPGERNGNPLHYSCLGNPLHRGVWQAIVCGVAKSWT